MDARRLAVLLVCFAWACGPGEDTRGGWTVTEGAGDETSYGDGSDTIVTADRTDDDTYIVSGSGDGCVEIDTGECIPPAEVKEEYCGDSEAQADIVVVDGEVVDVICYPPKEDGTPIEEVERDADGNANVPQNQNHTVVVFDESTNGEAIEGDLTLVAEGTVIYGNGVDETIIDGNVSFSSNNAQMRGVTIMGNVTFDKISNGSKLAYCKIYGNLTVEANNTTLVNCQVFGNVKVNGRNAKLVNIGVQGEWDVHASAMCDGCYSFDDGDGDFEVLDEELGDPLHCGDDDSR